MTAHPTALAKSVSEIERDFVSIEQRGLADPGWHFKIGVRADSTAVPVGSEAPSIDEPRVLAVFRRANPPSELTVVGALASREVDPADYLDCMLEIEGKTVISRRPVKTPGGVLGDAIATWSEGGQELAGRFFAAKWGPRIFLLCLRAERRHFDALADDFFVSLSTFSALDGSLGPFAEAVRTITNTTPIPYRAVLPESWVIELEPEAGERASSFQATQTPPGPAAERSVLFGKLSFAVIDRAEAKGGRAAASAYLEATRSIGVVTENEDFIEEEAAAPFEKSWLLVTKAAKGKNRPGELRCRVLLHKRVWVVAGVLGPAREDNALSWMQNKRALDVVTSTLRLSS